MLLDHMYIEMTNKIKYSTCFFMMICLFIACKDKGTSYEQVYCNSFIKGDFFITNINTLTHNGITLPQLLTDSILQHNDIQATPNAIEAIYVHTAAVNIWANGQVVPLNTVDSIEIYLTSPTISHEALFAYDTISLGKGGNFAPSDSVLAFLEMVPYNLVNIYKSGQPIQYFAKIKFNELHTLGRYSIELKSHLVLDIRQD